MIDPIISIKYMLAGFGVILGVLTLYVFSLFMRWQRLKHEIQILDDLDHVKG